MGVLAVTKALALLIAAAACGDDLGGLESTFEGGDARFFGTTALIGPPPELERMPIAGAEVCLVGDHCNVSNDVGAFLMLGPPAPSEVVFTASSDGTIPIAIAVIASASNERNLGTVPLQDPARVAMLAAAFGDDPQLDRRGAVLVLAERYDDGAIELAIEGATARYLSMDTMPDPAATSLLKTALFFGIEPGEVILQSTVGECQTTRDGWPGATLAEIRLPILAGHITLVRPQCLGGS